MGDMSEGPVTCRLARQEGVFISCPRQNHDYLNNLKGCGYGQINLAPGDDAGSFR